MSEIGIILRVYKGPKCIPRKLEFEKKCHSWTLQFLPMFSAMAMVPPATQYYDTGHTLRTVNSWIPSGQSIANPGVGVVNKGIVVGSGTGVEAATDYTITIIGHGTGAGQLSYGAGTFTEPAVVGTTSVLKFARVFTNSSPTNPITVKEFGIYGLVTYTFCISRDLTGDINIANGGASKTLEVTVTVDNTS